MAITIGKHGFNMLKIKLNFSTVKRIVKAWKSKVTLMMSTNEVRIKPPI